MHDVAAAAGVSLKTVSRAVNGEPNVAPATAERVARAVARLGYQVDDRARRLRRGAAATGVIGFVLVDVANDFFSAILRGLEDATRDQDLVVLSGSTEGDPDREEALIRAFVGRRVDGLVVVPSDGRDGSLRAEIDRGTPVVLVDLEPPGLPADVVRSDHRAGGALATQHLLDHGHADIAFLGDVAGIFSADERLAGFRTTMANAGLDVPAHRVVRARQPHRAWEHTGLALFNQEDLPDAVVTAQNLVTMGVVAALHRMGLHHRVALVGHDDVPMAAVVEPGITVVPQRPRELGRIAAHLLLARIEGDDAPTRRELLAPGLVARGSGELDPAVRAETPPVVGRP